jgi:hypothetical protein
MVACELLNSPTKAAANNHCNGQNGSYIRTGTETNTTGNIHRMDATTATNTSTPTKAAANNHCKYHEYSY